MARKPHPMHRQTGDQGQRFLVRAFGYPKADQANDIGYCNEQKSAMMMLRGIEMAPSARSVWVIDRQENQLVEWSGNPEDHIMHNHYVCSECNKPFDDDWSCAVDEDCPHCGSRHMTPVSSEYEPDCTCLMCQTRKEYADHD